MTFAWDITIPANTLATTPVEQELEITFGVITKVEIKFPSGCHGLVKCRLTRGGIYRLAPLSPDEWVTGDDEAASWHTYFLVDEPPNHVEFTGISPGTTYPHTVTVRLEILPRKVASMIPVLELLTRLLQRMGVLI